ncbi:hypothetical protein SR39_03945 [Methylobacterium radiotolerans]|uniref:hypothetical protein n=1 Tax=Methylobacterium TaxID=407 RepID=UPI0005BCF0A1|nr:MULTISPECIES: hypothetical protein [Methylobacterium]KIU36886.1 hypothetical protein SR39_03945 [Methylobacterium radiotolerans]ONF48297.1 hypothetical protein RSM1_15845 [Methylobacterium radiotolerans]RUP17249.1 MAG: hypothetical protein EKK44_30085 [Methylobacterium sp.]
MSTIDLLGLTLSFYGTMPPPRPPRPNRNGATWAAAVIFGGVCIATVGPMITIWSFHRPYAEAKARCIASGGRVLYGALDGSGPYRCERPAAAAAIAHPAKPAD